MMYSTVSCIKYDPGSMVLSSHEVVIEVPLAVFVNGRHALTAMVSPTLLEEFVTGLLYTERIIRKLEDIESLHIEENRERNREKNRDENREKNREKNRDENRDEN